MSASHPIDEHLVIENWRDMLPVINGLKIKVARLESSLHEWRTYTKVGGGVPMMANAVPSLLDACQQACDYLKDIAPMLEDKEDKTTGVHEVIGILEKALNDNWSQWDRLRFNLSVNQAKT